MAGDAPQEQRAPDQSPFAQAASDHPSGPSTEEMPRVVVTRRRLLLSTFFVVSVVALLYFVLPQLIGLKQTWSRIQHGDPWWLGLAALLEVGSFWGYIMLFRGVFARGAARIDWRASYEITMAGLAATRLFAAAGAGGVALTAWALRRAGMEARVAACRLIAFLVVQYGVYMAVLVICGFGLYLGIIPGRHPFAITVGPAIFGAFVIVVFLAISLVPRSIEPLVRRTTGRGWLAKVGTWLATASATTGSGVRTAIHLVRSRNPSLLGTVIWWGLNVAVLWASFRAFGSAPSVGVTVMAYFVGMLGNTLPLPGGIGGVDGGMIGALTAFGVHVQLAIVAVLTYRVFAFWLPTLPGAVAYLQLRRTVQRWRAAQAPSYT
jgi:uncharacterized protein (TIRG00374 family)